MFGFTPRLVPDGCAELLTAREGGASATISRWLCAIWPPPAWRPIAERPSRRRRCGQETQLTEHGQLVDHVPVLADPAIRHSVDIDAGDGERAAGGRDAGELRDMGSRFGPSDDNLVALGDTVPSTLKRGARAPTIIEKRSMTPSRPVPWPGSGSCSTYCCATSSPMLSVSPPLSSSYRLKHDLFRLVCVHEVLRSPENTRVGRVGPKGQEGRLTELVTDLSVGWRRTSVG